MTAFTEIRQQFSAFHLAIIPISIRYVRRLLLFRKVDIRIGRTSRDRNGSCPLYIARCKMHIFKDIRAKNAVTIRKGEPPFLPFGRMPILF